MFSDQINFNHSLKHVLKNKTDFDWIFCWKCWKSLNNQNFLKYFLIIKKKQHGAARQWEKFWKKKKNNQKLIWAKKCPIYKGLKSTWWGHQFNHSTSVCASLLPPSLFVSAKDTISAVVTIETSPEGLWARHVRDDGWLCVFITISVFKSQSLLIFS